LGKLDKVDDLEIAWPGGQKQKVVSVALNRLTVIEQQ
jgi:hypothetical protein